LSVSVRRIIVADRRVEGIVPVLLRRGARWGVAALCPEVFIPQTSLEIATLTRALAASLSSGDRASVSRFETEGSGSEPDFEQSGLFVAQVYPLPDRDRGQPRVGAACEKATGEWSGRRRAP
jgi:hypothetical protein